MGDPRLVTEVFAGLRDVGTSALDPVGTGILDVFDPAAADDVRDPVGERPDAHLEVERPVPAGGTERADRPVASEPSGTRF